MTAFTLKEWKRLHKNQSREETNTRVSVNSSSTNINSWQRDNIENRREGNGTNQKSGEEVKLVKLFLVLEDKDSVLKDAQRRNGSH